MITRSYFVVERGFETKVDELCKVDSTFSLGSKGLNIREHTLFTVPCRLTRNAYVSCCNALWWINRLKCEAAVHHIQVFEKTMRSRKKERKKKWHTVVISRKRFVVVNGNKLIVAQK